MQADNSHPPCGGSSLAETSEAKNGRSRDLGFQESEMSAPSLQREPKYAIGTRIRKVSLLKIVSLDVIKVALRSLGI
jgi:hypothetical protein